MGNILKASCACGFKSGELFAGFGMAGPEYCGTPVACPTCKRLWVQNHAKKGAVCRKCRATLYRLHDPENFGPADVARKLDGSFPWSVESIPSDNPDVDDCPPEFFYRCPKCGKMEMRLENAGLWD